MDSSFSLLQSKKKPKNSKSLRQVEFHLEGKEHENEIISSTRERGGALNQVSFQEIRGNGEPTALSGSKSSTGGEIAYHRLGNGESSLEGLSACCSSPAMPSTQKGKEHLDEPNSSSYKKGNLVIVSDDENRNLKGETHFTVEGVETSFQEEVMKKPEGDVDTLRYFSPSPTASGINNHNGTSIFVSFHPSSSHSLTGQGGGKEKVKSSVASRTAASFISQPSNEVGHQHRLPCSSSPDNEFTSCGGFSDRVKEWNALTQRGIMRCIDTGSLPSAIEGEEIENDYYAQLLKRSSLSTTGGVGVGAGAKIGNGDFGKKAVSSHDGYPNCNIPDGSRHHRQEEEDPSSNKKRKGHKKMESRKKKGRASLVNGRKKKKMSSSSSRTKTLQRNRQRRTTSEKRSKSSKSSSLHSSRSKSLSGRRKKKGNKNEANRKRSSSPPLSNLKSTGSRGVGHSSPDVGPVSISRRTSPIMSREIPHSSIAQSSMPLLSLPSAGFPSIKGREDALEGHACVMASPDWGEMGRETLATERNVVGNAGSPILQGENETVILHSQGAVPPVSFSNQYITQEEKRKAILLRSGGTASLQKHPASRSSSTVNSLKQEGNTAAPTDRDTSSFLTTIGSYVRESESTLHAPSVVSHIKEKELKPEGEKPVLSLVEVTSCAASPLCHPPSVHPSVHPPEESRTRSNSYCSSGSDPNAARETAHLRVSFEDPQKKKRASSVEKRGSGAGKKNKKSKKKGSSSSSAKQPVNRVAEKVRKSGSEKRSGKGKRGGGNMLTETSSLLRNKQGKQGSSSSRSLLQSSPRNKRKKSVGSGIGKRGGVEITELCLRKINTAAFESIKERKKRQKVITTEVLRAYEDGVRMFEAEYTSMLALVEKLFRETSFEPQTREILRLVEGIQFVRMDCEQKLGVAETVVNTLISGVENLLMVIHGKGSFILKEDETLVCDKQLDGTENSVSKAQGEPLPEVCGVLERLRQPIHPPCNTMALTEESKKGIDHFFTKEFDFIKDHRLQLKSSLVVPFFDNPPCDKVKNTADFKKGKEDEKGVDSSSPKGAQIGAGSDTQVDSSQAGNALSSRPSSLLSCRVDGGSIVGWKEEKKGIKKRQTSGSSTAGSGRRRESKGSARKRPSRSNSKTSSTVSSRRTTVQRGGGGGEEKARRKSLSPLEKGRKDRKPSRRSTRSSTRSSSSNSFLTRRNSSPRKSKKQAQDAGSLGSPRSGQKFSTQQKKSSLSFSSSFKSPQRKQRGMSRSDLESSSTALKDEEKNRDISEKTHREEGKFSPKTRASSNPFSFFSPIKRHVSLLRGSIPSSDLIVTGDMTRKSFQEVSQKYTNEIKAYSAFTRERTEAIQKEMGLLTNALVQLMCHVAKRHDLYRKKIISQQRLLDETSTHRKFAADVMESQKESQALRMDTIARVRSLGKELHERMDKVEKEMRETIQNALVDTAVVSHELLAYRDYSALAEKKEHVKKHVICRVERSMLDQAEIMRDLQYEILAMWNKAHPIGREERNTLLHRSLPTPYEKILQQCGKDTLIRLLNHLTLNNNEALRLLIAALDEHEHFLSTHSAEAQAAREDEATQTAVRALLAKLYAEGRIHCNPNKTSNSLTECIQSMIEQYNAFMGFTESYARALIRRDHKRQAKSFSTPFFHPNSTLPAVLQAIQDEHIKKEAARRSEMGKGGEYGEKIVPSIVKNSRFFSGIPHMPSCQSPADKSAVFSGSPSPVHPDPSVPCPTSLAPSPMREAHPLRTALFSSSLPPVRSLPMAHETDERNSKEKKKCATPRKPSEERKTSRNKSSFPLHTTSAAEVVAGLEKANPSISDPLLTGISVVGNGRWDGHQPVQGSGRGKKAMGGLQCSPTSPHHMPSSSREYSVITRALEAEAAGKLVLAPGVPGRKMLQEYILETYNHSSDEIGQLMATISHPVKTMKKFNNADIPFLERRKVLHKELEESMK